LTLSARLTVAMVALVIVTVAAVGWFTYSNLQKAIVPVEFDRLLVHTRAAAVDLANYVREPGNDMLALSGSEVLSGLVRASVNGGTDPESGLSAEMWRGYLAHTFESQLRAKSSYIQLRLIAAAGEGREILRVERSAPDGSIVTVPQPELQAKGQRDYFQRALTLPPGEVYVSPIELNQEHGTIQVPYLPVLRAATPIMTADGDLFGVLVVNLDMRPILERLRSGGQFGNAVRLVNDDGAYLVHPDPQRDFGWELGRPFGLSDEFPSLTDEALGDAGGVFPVEDSEGALQAIAIVPASISGTLPVKLVQVVPFEDLLQSAKTVGESSLLAGGVAILAATLLAAFMARQMSRPLSQMASAVTALSRGEPATLPVSAPSEIGQVAATLDHYIQRERLFGAAIESSDDAVIIGGLDGTITSWNPAAERMFGYSADEAVGANAAMLIPPGREEEFLSNRERLHRGETIRLPATERLRKSGDKITVSLTVSPVLAPDGTIAGGCAIERDMTERERLVDRLQQSEKMEAIGNLTGGIAHDFNNLLAVIIGNLDLLTTRVKGDTNSAELAETALQASLRGAELTRQLLAFARRQPLEPQIADVNERLTALVKLLERTLGAKVHIDLALSDGLWAVMIDPGKFDSAIVNLAVNARDAMQEEGTLRIATYNVSIDRDDPYIAVSLAPGRYILVEVSDTGSGMLPEVLNRAFEPFFTTKAQGKGTGLGLSMVFGFVTQSGGLLNAYSEPEQGTTFRLYFPRAEGETVSDDGQTPKAAAIDWGEGGHILVVEDNPAVRQVVTRQLQDLGYRVTETSSGNDALRILQRETEIDLVFSDVVMEGGIDGVELAKRIEQEWPKVKVLLTSGYPETLVRGKNAVSAGILSKPYRKSELAERIAQVMRS